MKMDKKTILIVVDMQHDFVDGSLGTPEAQAILHAVNKLISSGGFDDVYYTFDTHYPDYPHTFEGKKLPVPHCIYGTTGWALALENAPDDDIHTVIKNTFGHIEWTKTLGVIEETASSRIASITVIGLCTDICVISNALILRALFPNVRIICDAACCAGTTPEAHKAALAVMKSCQIDVINE